MLNGLGESFHRSFVNIRDDDSILIDELVEFSNGYFSHLKSNNQKTVIVPRLFEGEKFLFKIHQWNKRILSGKSPHHSEEYYLWGVQCQHMLPLLYGDNYLDQLNKIIYSMVPFINGKRFRTYLVSCFTPVDPDVILYWEQLANTSAIKGTKEWPSEPTGSLNSTVVKILNKLLK